MSAFATVGDTPYTIEQNNNLRQTLAQHTNLRGDSYFTVELRKGDGVSNIWFDTHNGTATEAFGYDADNKSGITTRIPFKTKGSISYDSNGSLIVNWIDNSGSSTSNEIAKYVAIGTWDPGDVLFQHDGVTDQGIGASLNYGGAGTYFLFNGYLKINDEEIGKVIFAMDNIGHDNIWIMFSTNLKNIGKINDKSYFALKGEKGNCYLFNTVGGNTTHNIFAVSQHNDGNYCEGLPKFDKNNPDYRHVNIL